MPPTQLEVDYIGTAEIITKLSDKQVHKKRKKCKLSNIQYSLPLWTTIAPSMVDEENA